MCLKSDNHDKVKNAMNKLQRIVDEQGHHIKQKFIFWSIVKWVVMLVLLAIVLIPLCTFIAKSKASGKKISDHPKTDNVVINSIGMKLIYVPSGEFMMGSSPGSKEQHAVKISKGFWIGQTEVTQAQWKTVRGHSPSHFKGDNLPVESVSWHDAVNFCSELSRIEGKTYRLPTVAEWIYACRGGVQK